MIPLLEFQDRSLNGPVMQADEFDLAFAMKVRKLVKKYEIEYDPEQLIPDDATADAVFQAGVDLLSDIGLYQLDTYRVVRFDRDEVLAVAAERKASPGEASFGSGDDTMTIRYREASDPRPATLYAGATGVADAEWFAAFNQSFAQEETIEGMGIAAGLARLGDVEPKVGTLTELHVVKWEQEQLREVLERVGRPGMNLGLLATASSTWTIVECLHPTLRDPRNTQVGVHISPEQKINWDRLLLSQFCQERGIVPWQSSMSLVGGLCRGPADVAVALVANMLGQMSYGYGPMCSLFSNHMDGNGATRATTWAICAAGLASARHIGMATGSSFSSAQTYSRTGFGLYQAAAVATAYTAAGFAYAWIAGRTGLDARLVGQVMRATAGMPRDAANDLVLRLFTHVEETIAAGDAPTARAFPEVYDTSSVKPKPEYEAELMDAMDEIAKAGVPLA